ncbi:MAG: hypothetical protein LBC39_08600 [Methanobrevibacter sp.]|jgi:hypothetical protein|nr:hypothetical protein [Candidatus Methanovirga aequatorialis]
MIDELYIVWDSPSPKKWTLKDDVLLYRVYLGSEMNTMTEDQLFQS